jgi:transcriptional regulator with XRE-family HTH domain
MTPFRRKRLAAGLTQQQLADRLGVSQSAVVNWEREKNRDIPQAEHFPKLAKIFGISAEEVTHLFDEPAASTA